MFFKWFFIGSLGFLQGFFRVSLGVCLGVSCGFLLGSFWGFSRVSMASFRVCLGFLLWYL